MTDKEAASDPPGADRDAPRFPQAAAARSPYGVMEKVDLLERRLASLRSFQDIELDDFIERLPGFERVMPLLAQSAVDICHAMLQRYTMRTTHSTVDIVSSCEHEGLLPPSVVGPLSRELVLIEAGYGRIDASELMGVHQGLPRTANTFRDFLDHVRDYVQTSEEQ